MKYDVPLRYLARAFVDADALSPSDADALTLAQGELGGMSAVRVAEQGLDGRPPRQRLAFTSPTRDRALTLGSTSFDYVAIPTDVHGTNLDWEAFVDQSSVFLAATAAHFGRQPHRLALVQEGMLPEMSEDAMAALRDRLLIPIPGLVDAAPFEWDWRMASREPLAFGNRSEICNKVTTLKRTSGSLLIRPADGLPAEQAYDRIRIDIDVNTSPQDTRGRFDRGAIAEFFVAARDELSKISLAITSQIEKKS